MFCFGWVLTFWHDNQRWSYFRLCSLTVENWEGAKNEGRRNPTGDITIILTITIFIIITISFTISFTIINITIILTITIFFTITTFFITTTFFIFINITRVLKSSMKVSANILTIKLTMGLTIAHRVTDNQIVQRHHGPRRKGQVIHGPWLRLLIVLRYKYKLYYFTNTGSNSSFN